MLHHRCYGLFPTEKIRFIHTAPVPLRACCFATPPELQNKTPQNSLRAVRWTHSMESDQHTFFAEFHRPHQPAPGRIQHITNATH